jgi:hypothetical protein
VRRVQAGAAEEVMDRLGCLGRAGRRPVASFTRRIINRNPATPASLLFDPHLAPAPEWVNQAEYVVDLHDPGMAQPSHRLGLGAKARQLRLARVAASSASPAWPRSYAPVADVGRSPGSAAASWSWPCGWNRLPPSLAQGQRARPPPLANRASYAPVAPGQKKPHWREGGPTASRS